MENLMLFTKSKYFELMQITFEVPACFSRIFERSCRENLDEAGSFEGWNLTIWMVFSDITTRFYKMFSRLLCKGIQRSILKFSEYRMQ